MLSVLAYFTAHLLYKHCTNCTVCTWTVLTVITQMLLLHVQLHNSTAHLLYKYCTNCTVCNWTVLTVITHKLLLHVQLHNSTAHLLYKYCTNCTVCNWTVLTVITHKLLLHVQLHNRRETVKLMCSEEDCSRLFNTLCVYSLSYHKIGAFIFTLLAASTVSQIDSSMEKLNVEKKIDWHTVQIEGQLKYSLCQMPICVNTF